MSSEHMFSHEKYTSLDNSFANNELFNVYMEVK